MTRGAAWAWTVAACAAIGLGVGGALGEWSIGAAMVPGLLALAWLLGWPPPPVDVGAQPKMLQNPNRFGGDGGGGEAPATRDRRVP
jgi:hypothetical protein